MDIARDITGQTFGRLKVLRRDGTVNKKATWLCECSCENKTLKVICGTDLRKGHTTSCGCRQMEVLRKRNFRHGSAPRKHKTLLYQVWEGMKARCYNKNHTAYKYYGGRGVRVCGEWKEDHVQFSTWATESDYKIGLSLERKDVNGEYCPANCCWILPGDQNKNKRNSLFVSSPSGKILLSDLSRNIQVPYSTLYWRIKQGWKWEDVVRAAR